MRMRIHRVCPMVLGFLAMLTLLVFPAAASAADGETALGPGAWAVELGLDIDDSSEAGQIALKRNSSESTAWRFGIGVQALDIDADGNTQDTSIGYEADAFSSQGGNSLAFFLHWVRYGRISDRVAAQLGLGPVVELTRTHFRQGEATGTPQFFESESTQEVTSYGVDLSLGVEWFFSRRLSLGGQAGIRGLLGSFNQVSISRSGTGPTYAFDRTERDGDVNSLRTNSSRIVLTGYF